MGLINAEEMDGVNARDFLSNASKPEKVNLFVHERNVLVNSSLHDAARDGNLELVTLLLLEEINRVNERDEDGNIPLHLAARNGHLDVVEKLIKEGARIDAKNYENLTPLELAIYYNKLVVVNFLVNCKDHLNNTLLHYAAKDGNLALIVLLLEKGANVNEKGMFGYVPLYFALIPILIIRRTNRRHCRVV